MMETAQARFERGAFIPPEELSLPEGAEVTLSFRRTADEEKARDAMQSVAGAWKCIVDGEALKRDIYASRKANTRPAPRL